MKKKSLKLDFHLIPAQIKFNTHTPNYHQESYLPELEIKEITYLWKIYQPYHNSYTRSSIHLATPDEFFTVLFVILWCLFNNFSKCLFIYFNQFYSMSLFLCCHV